MCALILSIPYWDQNGKEMSFTLLVNDEKVFSTEKRVRSIGLAGDLGFIADVPASVSVLKLTVKESDNINVHLDDVQQLADRTVVKEPSVTEAASEVPVTGEGLPSDKNAPTTVTTEPEPDTTTENTDENDNVTSL